MKRAIVIIACFAIVFGAGAGVYLGYSYHKEAVEFDSFKVNYAYVDSKGVFKGDFSTDRVGMLLCDYEYEIEGDTMYITFYQTVGTKRALEHDEDDYVKIEIPDCKGVKKLYYRCGDDEDKIKMSA